MTKRKALIYAIESRRTLILAGPIMLGQVSHILLGIIDSLMVGHLGTIPLAAASLGHSIFVIPLVFGFGVSGCISALVARADGENNLRECGEILRHGLVMNFVMALGLALLVEAFIPFMVYLDQPPGVLQEAVGFLRVISWSMIPALVFQAFKNYSDGMHKTGAPMVVMMSSVVLNAGLNYLLIFGHWGFPEWGLLGSGVATLITRLAMMVAMAILVLRSPAFEMSLPLQWLSRLQWRRFARMLSVGFPSGLQALFEVGAFSLAAVMMGWISAEALAAHQIALNVASVTFMIPLGLSFAVSIRVGNAMGMKLPAVARRIGLGSLAIALLMSIVFTLMFFLTRSVIPGFYSIDTQVLELAGVLFVVAGCFQLFDGLQVVGAGALRGLLDIRYPTIVTFVAYWVLSLPGGYWFAFHLKWGAAGIWWGLTLGLLVAATLLVFRFNRLTKQRNDS
jgi:MATE family multidrug resistance protein